MYSPHAWYGGRALLENVISRDLSAPVA